MRLKLIRWLFIPFACILLMSHNTSAFQVSLNVQRVWSNFFTRNITWTYDNGSTYVNSNITGAKTIKSITFTSVPNSSGCQANDIYEFTFMLRNWTNDNSSDINIDNMGTSQNAWEFMGANVSQANASTGLLQLYLLKTASGVNCGTADFTIPNGSSQGNLIELHANETIEFSVANIFRPVSDTNYTSNFQAIVNAIQNTPDYSDELQDITDAINDSQEKEDEAVDNISEQTPSDISQSGGSGENSQTTSLLATLGSFLTAITNLQATNCNVVLAFPQFAGGSQTVNICQNKEYTGNIVSIAGSVILVMFYLPVAFMLVSKIYSEIRSFTNG